MVEKILFETVFFVITLIAYLTGRVVYRKTGIMLLHTIIVSTALIILLFRTTGVDLRLYEENTKVIRFLLNLSVVAFGFLLYKNYEYIKEKGVSILFANFMGSLSAVVSIAVILVLSGADIEAIITVLPKSVTTPIAIELSEQYGGMVYLTAVIVILSGIFGAVIGPWFLKITGIKPGFGQGLALGAASHGIGTAKALEMGLLQGAAGGLAIALMGVITSLIMPLIIPFVKIMIYKSS